VASTHEEIQARVDQLEQEVRALESSFSGSVRRADGRGGESGMDRISFAVWLQITGPTFATMVLGFGVLWNSQQVLAAQQLEGSRSIGRLEGSIAGMERSLAGMDRSLTVLGDRIDKLGTSVDRLADRVSALEIR
jgi:outer membrane murein-binding lipoprotein Lpp